MNSRWSRGLGAARDAVLTLLVLACGGEQRKPAAATAEQATPEGSAQLLGRELSDIIDRIMAYRSSHRGQLPASLRQAGIDSLTPVFSREYRRQGSEPLVIIRFRNTAGHPVAACRGTSQVLEDAMLHEGRFDVTCERTSGATESFTIVPPPPPKKDDD